MLKGGKVGFINDFAQIDRKFAWSFLGFVLAAIFGGIAVYTEFIRDTSPVLRYELTGNTKILDVKEDVAGLSIIYNNEEIRKSKKTLSVVTVKVINDGRSAILKSFYDPASPLGITIGSGQIIKAEIIDSSTPYLMNSTTARQLNPTTAIFSDVIIEPTEFFVVKLLVLNPENAVVTVVPIGKVANVKRILLQDAWSEKPKESFFTRAFSGSIWVQLARVPAYFVGFFILIISIFGPIAFVIDRIEKRHRRKVLKQFKVYSDSKYEELNAKIYEFYEDHGVDMLLKLRKAVSDEEKFQTFAEENKKYLSEEDNDKDEDVFIGIAAGTPPHERRRQRNPAFILKSLIKFNLISREGEGFRRNEDRISALSEFIDFVTIKEA